MASAPNFASVPIIGNGNISTANANRDGTGTLVTIYTAPTAGARIERVVTKATGDPADSIITLFLYDGTLYHIFDEIDIGNPAAGSATVVADRQEVAYRDLVLPSGWSLRAGVTVAPVSGWIEVFAFGAELT